MPLVVGVSFRRVGKVYYFDPGDLALEEGDFVIAETAHGVEFGHVALKPREVPEEELVAPLKNVLRVATGDDLQREADNRGKEKHAYEVCELKIADHQLPMKLLDAEYAFDSSQVTFSFSADGRIDFRELVKDVAGTLKIKVQLHQIGVRDEARLIGGFGPCGRSLCCATFLTTFEPISMKMAKDQSLFLNPAKFSGSCGKLMCCLRYEHEHYKCAQKRLPSIGAILQLEECKGKIIDINMISETLTLQTEDDVIVHIKASDLNMEGICRKHGCVCNMSERNCERMITDENELAAHVAMSDDEEIVEEDAVILDDWDGPIAGVVSLLDNIPLVNTSSQSIEKDERVDVDSGVTWREPKPDTVVAVDSVAGGASADSDASENGNGNQAEPEKNGNGSKPKADSRQDRYKHRGQNQRNGRPPHFRPKDRQNGEPKSKGDGQEKGSGSSESKE